MIPKRYEASAVARNTIKRRWRAAFRTGRAAWAGEFGSADLVVRMQAPLAPKAERAATPAKVLVRRRFDPQAALASLIERLRRRDGRGRAPRDAARGVSCRRSARDAGDRRRVRMLGAIAGYRLVVSPWLPSRCRFAPSCSAYAAEAIRMHGPLAGCGSPLARIARCHPWQPGGHDPVPAGDGRRHD